MRKDVAFNTEDGITIRAWHYVPEEQRGKVPTIVMAHGFSAVKEMYLDWFAEAFAAAGLASVVFDNRNFGASDGSPRQEVDPWQQVRDYRDAITYAETLKETDPERVGIWGTSYSGGHVLAVGALDRRVKCVVSQVPLVSGPENARRLIRHASLLGASLGFIMQWWVHARGYPLVISGKPYFSWPAYIPITFELGVLFAALGAVLGMLGLNQLPMHHHPLFRSKVFEQVTDDAFFISIESWDPRFDPSATGKLLESLGARSVELVES